MKIDKNLKVETKKGKYSKIILKETRQKMTKKRKKQNREQKRKKKTYNNEKTPYLQKNEVCLLSPNFKPTSNQTKMQKVKRNTLFLLY